MKANAMKYLLLILSFAWIAIAPAATIPMPDHILFGTIAIDGRPVTRADTDVVVEVRRTAGGPVLASYRMGANQRLGEYYYVLRLPVASASTATASQAILGETLLVSVRGDAGTVHQVTHRVADSGTALRLDFGAGVDTDGDDVPDGWELATLGTTNTNLRQDTDGDGANDRAEYDAGTSPTNAADVFRLALLDDGAQVRVSFRALRAAGRGFEGKTRYYTVESSTNAVSGPWRGIENFTRIQGNDQLMNIPQSKDTNAPVFFRARVWVE